MRDKQPMEYLMDFFTELFKILYRAASKIGVAGYEAWKAKQDEKKRNELVDANERPKQKRPKEIENKMSKDNMDISVEDYNKLSRKEKKEYKRQWNALSEAERGKRREEFSKKQLPKLQEAANSYFKKKYENIKEISDMMSQDGMNMTRAEWNAMNKKDREYYKDLWNNKYNEADRKKHMEEFHKKQQPKIEEAMKKHGPKVYEEYMKEVGNVSLFRNVEQRVPKGVADEMAFELRNFDGTSAGPMDISRGDYEKLSTNDALHLCQAWQKLKPEEKKQRLAAFEKKALPKIDKAWKEYERVTGNTREVDMTVFTHDSAYYMDAMDKQIREQQKKKTGNEKQKEEIQDQKFDGKENAKDLENNPEKEQERLKEANKKEEVKQEEVKQEDIRKDNIQQVNQVQHQGFGRRRENDQLNQQQLNAQINNLQNVQEHKGPEQNPVNRPVYQQQNNQQNEFNDDDLDEQKEALRERVKKGAENRRQKDTEEMQQLRANNGPNKDNNALNNNRPMIPNNK